MLQNILPRCAPALVAALTAGTASAAPTRWSLLTDAERQAESAEARREIFGDRATPLATLAASGGAAKLTLTQECMAAREERQRPSTLPPATGKSLTAQAVEAMAMEKACRILGTDPGRIAAGQRAGTSAGSEELTLTQQCEAARAAR